MDVTVGALAVILGGEFKGHSQVLKVLENHHNQT